MIERTLYFGNPAYLSLKLQQLVIKRENEHEVQVPIEDIGVIVLDHQQITITQAVLASLLDANVAVVTTDDKHLPIGLLLPLAGHSVQAERFRTQIDAGAPLKKRLWQQVVRNKIENQGEHLRQLSRGGDIKLKNLAKQVKSGDSGNHESQAAVIYWKLLFKQDYFVRRRLGPPPNALLNYGYAILRAIIARGTVAAGLLPTLGIHHHNRYNAYALADDLMEPYRPFVDQVVVELVENGIGEEITVDTKRRLLEIPTVEVGINGESWRLMDAADQTAQSLAQCLARKRDKLALPHLCR